ncbi:hypothetical protein CK203_011499 [Vitis vinifera]|uniref:Uncharacterized protein n=1 Tax=Vitis vinifera TaxID=29760 RepID=A0A438JU98_VITVI|nr:hypothetical protein CK203_011499 [Vitis vinifera]
MEPHQIGLALRSRLSSFASVAGMGGFDGNLTKKGYLEEGDGNPFQNGAMGVKEANEFALHA